MLITEGGAKSGNVQSARINWMNTMGYKIKAVYLEIMANPKHTPKIAPVDIVGDLKKRQKTNADKQKKVVRIKSGVRSLEWASKFGLKQKKPKDNRALVFP